MTSKQQVQSFLETLYCNCDGFISTFCIKSKRSRYFDSNSLGAMADYIHKIGDSEDIYVGLSTYKKKPRPNQRGSTNLVRSVPALFADIDISSLKSTKKAYPKTRDEALEILTSFAPQPTFITDSGNGFHALWVLEDPFQVLDKGSNEKIREISSGFQRAILNHYRQSGRDVDSVGDLVRLLRPPGTYNHKSKPISEHGTDLFERNAIRLDHQ